jgi:dihydrofolate reductase
MTTVTCRFAMSLDGYIAGPHQSASDPFGEGGLELCNWMFQTKNPGRQGDQDVIDEAEAGIGAFVMGRNMFGPDRGEWDLEWTGWWGEDTPYHVPSFVLSHHPREALTMKGGNTFTFVTDGVASALEQATAAAGDKKVAIGGGAATARQFLAAGLIDELYLHIVPITLGAGERLFDGLGDFKAEPVKVSSSPAVTHIKYEIVH